MLKIGHNLQPLSSLVIISPYELKNFQAEQKQQTGTQTNLFQMIFSGTALNEEIF